MTSGSVAPGWRRASRRQLLAGVGGAGAAGLLLAACGGGDDKKSGGTTSGQASQSGTAAAAAPVRGGTLRVSYQTPTHFDPFLTGSFSTHQARSFVNDKLITFAQGPDVQRGARVLQGQLAEKWESPDGLAWLFHMRPGVKFNNVAPVNGRPVTTEDARWSFERGMDPKAFQYSEFRPLIKGVSAADNSTLRVDLSEPFAPFLQYVASDYSWVWRRSRARTATSAKRRRWWGRVRSSSSSTCPTARSSFRATPPTSCPTSRWWTAWSGRSP